MSEEFQPEPAIQTDAVASEPGSDEQSFFHHAKWNLPHLCIGVLVLLGVWSVSFLPPDLMKRIPIWVYLVFSTGGFFAFLTFYPFWGIGRRFRFPRAGKIFIEAAIAIPLTIGVIVMLGVVNYVWTQVAPETSLTPEIWWNMAGSNQFGMVAIVMLLATTIVPIAEEIFFRGYLYNAFRARSSPIIATIVSSLIFAIVHSYGAAPTAVVFVLGICLTGIYLWRKTLLTPMFVHAGINFVSMSVLLLTMLVYARTPVLGIASAPCADGVRITSVDSESGAGRAGVQAGDILTEIDRRPVRSIRDVIEHLQVRKIGDTVQVTLIRDNTTMEKSVVLGARPAGTRSARQLRPTSDSNR